MKKLKKNIAIVSALAAGTIVAGGAATTISEISQHNVGTFVHSASVGDVAHKPGFSTHETLVIDGGEITAKTDTAPILAPTVDTVVGTPNHEILDGDKGSINAT
jgi:hypothetical protein